MTHTVSSQQVFVPTVKIVLPSVVAIDFINNSSFFIQNVKLPNNRGR